MFGGACCLDYFGSLPEPWCSRIPEWKPTLGPYLPWPWSPWANPNSSLLLPASLCVQEFLYPFFCSGPFWSRTGHQKSSGWWHRLLSVLCDRVTGAHMQPWALGVWLRWDCNWVDVTHYVLISWNCRTWPMAMLLDSEVAAFLHLSLHISFLKMFLDLMRILPGVFQGFPFPSNQTSHRSSWAAVCLCEASTLYPAGEHLDCPQCFDVSGSTVWNIFILARVSRSALPVGGELLPGRMGECLTLENNLVLSYKEFLPASSDPSPPLHSVFLFWIFASWTRMKWYFIWS